MSDDLEELAAQWAKKVRGTASGTTAGAGDVPATASTKKRLALPVVHDHADDVETYERPKTRGDCLQMERPCPFVSCRYHLYLDVHPMTGQITVWQPDLEVWEMIDTCALDVADEQGVTLEQVAVSYQLTRERIRQIESGALEKLRKRMAYLADGEGYGRVQRRTKPVTSKTKGGVVSAHEVELDDDEATDDDYADGNWERVGGVEGED